MEKRYELLRDLPYCKAGAIYKQDENGNYVTKDVNPYDQISQDTIHKEAVENNPEWFKELTNTPVQEDAFKWDEDKALKLALWISELGLKNYPEGWCQPGGSNGFHYSSSDLISDFKSKQTPKETNTDTKQERLYSEDDLIGLLRDAVSCTWGNQSFTETQELFNKFLLDRKLVTPTLKDLNNFITNKVNEIIYDKKYSEKELLAAEEKAFEARIEINPQCIFVNKEWFKYPTFSDYKNSKA